MELKYRADIDGLRAIAVLAVLFFHTDVPGFSGGFVGVDVFFVISGYLITSIILKEIKAENFSIARFYERRIRRIFPALFPVMVFVLVVGAYLFDASAFKDLGQSITATTLFSSNILFWRESGYFAAPSLQKPLLHTWSLAVEEQFYIFFPLALMAIHRYLKGRYFFWIVLAFIISLGASIYGVAHHPGATFYLVPTRAWELMVGSILAFGTLPDLSKNWQRNVLTLSGLALILFSVFFYTESTPFPGIAALAPVIGSGLIIYTGRGGGTHSAQKLLTARPLVFIGLISYSLYLWHWPLVAFTKYLLFRPLNGVDSAVIILASLLFATFSWKFIEQPFRGKQMLLAERKKLFAVAGVVMVVAVGIGGGIHLQKGMQWRYPLENMIMNKAKNDSNKAKNDSLMRDLRFKLARTSMKINNDAAPPIIGDKNTQPVFALVGDSHAIALIPAMSLEASKVSASGYAIALHGTPFVLGIKKRNTGDKWWNVEWSTHNAHVIDFLKKKPNIKYVFLAASWGGHWYKPKDLIDIAPEYPIDEPGAKIFEAGLTRAVKELLAMHRKVILISDVPRSNYDIPSAYFVSATRGFIDINSIRPTILEYDEQQGEANAFLEKLAKLPDVILVRPEQRMFDITGRGMVMSNDALFYIDNSHLSTAGALYVAPVFEPLFKEMARSQSAHQRVSEVSEN